MARRTNIFARYGDDVVKVGKVEITGQGKIIAVPPSDYGVHTTYPPDGRIHRTSNTSTGGVERVFRDPPGPPLSNVTLYAWDSLAIPAGGPPPHARPARSITGPVFDAPQMGVGRVLVAAAAADYVDEARESIEKLTSGSTELLGFYESLAYVLIWDPTDQLSNSTTIAGLRDVP